MVVELLNVVSVHSGNPTPVISFFALVQDIIGTYFDKAKVPGFTTHNIMHLLCVPQHSGRWHLIWPIDVSDANRHISIGDDGRSQEWEEWEKYDVERV